MRNFTFVFLIVFFVFSSCVEEDYSLRNEKTPNYKITGFGLTLKDMQNIGRLHNEIALELHQNIDLKCSDCEDEVASELKGILQSRLITLLDDDKLVEEWTNNWVDNSIADAKSLEMVNYNLEEWKADALSKEGHVFFKSIQKLINTSSTIYQVNTSIDVLINEISSSSLSEFEKELLISSGEVARNSFVLWAPETIGGIGLYNRINNPKNGILRKWCWKCAAAGDVAGLATYFTGLGVAGAISASLIPGVNGAIAVGAGASAVGGSIWGGIQITNQNVKKDIK